MKLTSAAQMREMDQQTIEDYGVPSIVLMENAAHCVLEAIAHRYAPLAGKHIAVVCGKGNNGGDGFAIARHLATRYEAEASVWLIADPSTLTGDAKINHDLAQKFGLEIHHAGGEIPMGFATALARADIVVDALFGTGIRGAVTDAPGEAICLLNLCPAPIIAVDVPSGLIADTGQVLGPCVRAACTVTFALPKYGLVEYPGIDYVGELVIADIGMPRPVMQAAHVKTAMTEAAEVGNWLPARTENRDSNKGKFGHVFVLAGSQGFVGAPVLTAESAARTGAGLVTLVVPTSVQTPIMSRVSPVVMTKGLPQTEGGTFSKDALSVALKLCEKADAVALGPGIGGVEDDETRSFVKEFIAECAAPLVIDADALNILAAEPDHGASLVKQRSAPTVLTPHPAEMGRLLGISAKDVQDDRRVALETAVQAFGCVVLLKGARTLVSDPGGTLYLNVTGNSGMATGGAGDALTGIIAALLAGHLLPLQAAAAGAYLHGLAGDLVAQDHGGKAGLIATDIIEALPRALGECLTAGSGRHVERNAPIAKPAVAEKSTPLQPSMKSEAGLQGSHAAVFELSHSQPEGHPHATLPGGLPQLVGTQGLAAGSVFALTDAMITVGRDGNNAIVLAENAVSYLHARLMRDEAGQISVIDENSANGVFVNGARVQQVMLAAGDELQIGENFFRFEA